jgi:hypothetical protein
MKMILALVEISSFIGYISSFDPVTLKTICNCIINCCITKMTHTINNREHKNFSLERWIYMMSDDDTIINFSI